MTMQITRLAAEFILELSKATPEDYLQLKLMMLSAVRHPQVETFLQKVFSLADEKRPQLIEFKSLYNPKMINIFSKLRRRNSWKQNPRAGAVLLPIPKMLRQQSDQERQ